MRWACLSVLLAPGQPAAATSWSSQFAPLPPGAQGGVLNAVSCTSATACTAVGHSANKRGRSRVLVERWNGSRWSTQAAWSSPNRDADLLGVSCTSKRACTAVGYIGYADPEFAVNNESIALVERWNGSRWRVQPIPKPKQTYLDAVACASQHACLAVGMGSGPCDYLAERWNGSSWSTLTCRGQIGPPGYAEARTFSGVSCLSRISCVAVGQELVGSGFGWEAVAARWNGTQWTDMPIGTTGETGVEALTDVSCSNETSCTAIGWDPRCTA